eukprot:TRINITY_DN1613_c0_g1_i1.p1 TRINITY_DN1613_c0_g1~~TRINITY_DN1613_c0_g1_i1.p1  ORF type:complete len:156 (+),score=19.29 TRINITY_DN1613_c0_g1_i1:79-546(+)
MTTRSVLLPLLLLVVFLGLFDIGAVIPGVTGPKKKVRWERNKKAELRGCPQKGGVVTRVYTMSPKKPNSAIRKVCRIKLSTGVESTVYIPGEGHSLQEFSSVLMRGGRRKDLVGVKYVLCRGARDLAGVAGRTVSRSQYGVTKPDGTFRRDKKAK